MNTWTDMHQHYNQSSIKATSQHLNMHVKRKEWKEWNRSLQPGPQIDSSIISRLPKFIQQVLGVSPDSELDGLAILSTLSILSSLIPLVKGKFSGKEYRANLFLMVLAPPASNKSLVKQLVGASSLIDKEIWKGTFDSQLIKTGRRGLYVSGNISKSALIDELDKLPNCNLLFESEIDSVSHVLGQEWGGHSDVLRKVSEHETISLKRKDKPAIRVDQPCLTMILTGTQSQVHSMIDDVSNGLASRFIYYTFQFSRYIKESDRQKLNSYSLLNSMRADFLEFFKYHLECPREFKLSKEQITDLDILFEDLHSQFSEHDNHRSTAMRLKTVLYRICMVLGSIEAFEKNRTRKQITCSMVSFRAACDIVRVLLEHSILVTCFIAQSKLPNLPLDQQKVLLRLNDTYKTSELYREVKNVVPGLTDKTARNWNSGWITKGIVKKKSHGTYMKLQQQ